MSAPQDFHVAFLGFGDFERSALASCFRLAGSRVPRYAQVQELADADFVVADSDHPPSVQLATATGWLEQTVFVGSRAPAGARAWLHRPIDPIHVMRELDAMVKTAGDFPLPTPSLPDAATPEASAPDDAVPTVPGVLAIHPEPAGARAASATPPSGSKRKARAPLAADAPIPVALLVDDSALALRFLESRLLPWGLKIESATHSERALELLEQRSYGFAFLDVELGEGSELDGLALCRHIRQSPSAVGLTIFMVSAYHSELDRVRGSLAGCDGYLAKPLDESELTRLLLRHGLRDPAEAPSDPTLPPG
jgi:CheY-like chemotaxis protein